MYADFALLNQDILNVSEETLLQTEAELTVVDGEVQYASQTAYPALYKKPEAATPAWSPVNQ